MRVLFLDIDGVLTTERSRTIKQRESLDASCLKRLRDLIAATDVKVVITSTWRKWRTQANLQEYLGILVYDVTPVFHTPNHPRRRGQEIRAWLDLHPDVDRYVILDDENGFTVDQIGRWVRTDDAEGLTDAACALAAKLLA